MHVKWPERPSKFFRVPELQGLLLTGRVTDNGTKENGPLGSASERSRAWPRALDHSREMGIPKSLGRRSSHLVPTRSSSFRRNAPYPSEQPYHLDTIWLLSSMSRASS